MIEALAARPSYAGGTAAADGLAQSASTTGATAQDAAARARAALRQLAAVILAGERLAEAPGALTAVARLASQTGASLAWIPRRAGERGAIEAGALHPAARRPACHRRGGERRGRKGLGARRLPPRPGRDTVRILTAAAVGELPALLVAGVDLMTCPTRPRHWRPWRPPGSWSVSSCGSAP